ncbi:hypothetical protein RJT34_13179 [Clitoria ternatea]|uniref:Uncharacterized protein n=1 Tax=Clitoria ternatea TaxID=43366 RepID=A0AAN9JQP4_CLITE
MGSSLKALALKSAMKLKATWLILDRSSSGCILESQQKNVRLKTTGNKPVKASKLQDKEQADDSGNSVTTLSNADTKEISQEHSSLELVDLFKVVSFKRENFVQSWHPPGKQFDTILW